VIGLRDLCARERYWDARRFAEMPTVDVELGSPLPDAVCPDDASHVHAVLRVDRVPVGEVVIEPVDRALDRDTLARRLVQYAGARVVKELARQALLRAGDADHAAPAPLLTLAVCTRDRAEGLRATLDALARQTRSGLDILVVDNAPSNEATARVARELPTARYVVEPRPGLDHARNRALAEARGEMLAYTDDDVIPDPEWAASIARGFEHAPEAAAITGLVLPAELRHAAQLLFESYGGFGRGFDRIWWHVDDRAQPRTSATLKNTGRFGTGANMAFRTAALEALGGFDPALDVGTESLGGGDLDVFFRVVKSGATLLYDPGVVVRHRHRDRLDALGQQLEQWGSGMAAYEAAARRRFPDEGAAFDRFDRSLELGWFRRRQLLSYLREAFPRDLIACELRGRRAGADRYARASQATGAAMSMMRPASVVPPLEPHRAYDVDLRQPLMALAGSDRARQVSVRVRRGDRDIATIAIRNGGQPVGRARLAEGIAAAVPMAVLGESPERVLSSLHQRMRRTVAPVRAPVSSR
jgi:glycosyltransferase involved in cell wall biosynthesis